MLFNSFVFLVFAACFFAFWPLAKTHARTRWFYITVASFVFYGWWDYRFLFLIIASGLLDYAAALLMCRLPRWKTPLLAISIGGNIGTLVAFKYGSFLAANLDSLGSLVGLPTQFQHNLPAFMLVLPVGISFYTFQSMSYTIDVYRGQLVPTKDPFHFFAYLALFPQLVAGPILRASDLLPQLAENRRTTEPERWEGLRLIMHGYFKKVVIADHFAPIVDSAFTQSAGVTSGLYWWMVITLFAFQIYCDFSGYSDIARGLCKWMGYDIPVNFNHPYGAQSMREFWQRWHISLSTWFRDYVYIPLGGSRHGAWRTERNAWITMLASGIWHGAAWHFVLWGALHSLFLSVERWTRWPQRLGKLPGGPLLATFLCIGQVWIAWVFFRATGTHQALAIVTRMLTDFTWQNPLGRVEAVLLAAVVLREVYCAVDLRQWHWRWAASPQVRSWAESAALALMAVACVYLEGPGHEFIYFQF